MNFMVEITKEDLDEVERNMEKISATCTRSMTSIGAVAFVIDSLYKALDAARKELSDD